MRLYFVMRYFRFRILGPLFLAFTGFTLFSEIFKWRRTWSSFTMLHSSNKDVSISGARYSYQQPYIERNSTHFVPGMFLKGIFPKNYSYCNFTYGTPDNFNWTEKYVAYSPELGKLGPYRVIYDVIKVSDYKASAHASNSVGVTYCTHATPEFVYNIVEIVHRWDGPVSIAVYAPYTDAGLTLVIINHLCHCLPEMAKLSLHLIYPVNYPPVFTSVTLPTLSNFDSKIYQQLNFLDCSAPKAVLNGKLETFRQSEGLTYPVNVARNVARMAATSSHVLVSDVELLPSQDLVPAFVSMLSRFRRKRIEGDGMDAELSPPLPVMPEPRMKKFVFVLPVFEVDENELDVPTTKEKLLDLYAQSKAVYFHRWVCIHCQRFPGLQRWLQRKPSVEGPKLVQPLLVVRREYPFHRWEPVYIGTSKEPLYSELLTWEGQQDKMTQMNEMCLMGYRFVILDGAFLVHVPGIKRKSELSVDQTAWRRPYERHNIKMYHSITLRMTSKYGTNTRCKI